MTQVLLIRESRSSLGKASPSCFDTLLIYSLRLRRAQTKPTRDHMAFIALRRAALPATKVAVQRTFSSQGARPVLKNVSDAWMDFIYVGARPVDPWLVSRRGRARVKFRR